MIPWKKKKPGARPLIFFSLYATVKIVTRFLGNQNGDARLQKGHWKIYHFLTARIDLQGGHDYVSLVADKLGYKSIPFALANGSSPFAIADPVHSNKDAS